MKMSELIPKLDKSYEITMEDDFYIVVRGRQRRYIHESQDINEDLFRKYFDYGTPDDLRKSVDFNNGGDDYHRNLEVLFDEFAHGMARENDEKFVPGKPKSMIPDSNDPVFKNKSERGDLSGGHDIDVPPGVRFDPILPTKNKKKGKGPDPDPDHFRRPGGGDLF